VSIPEDLISLDLAVGKLAVHIQRLVYTFLNMEVLLCGLK
jgi:hypothetical protein